MNKIQVNKFQIQLFNYLGVSITIFDSLCWSYKMLLQKSAYKWHMAYICIDVIDDAVIDLFIMRAAHTRFSCVGK